MCDEVSNFMKTSSCVYFYSDKIYKLLEFTGSSRDVADPWYTGEFETTYNDITNGVKALYEFLDK